MSKEDGCVLAGQGWPSGEGRVEKKNDTGE